MDSIQFNQWCEFYNRLPLEKNSSPPLIMGILNITPDSFSDGGRYETTAQAVERALEMINEGADLIDIGGESSRPGALKVSEAEELARVIPVIEKLAATHSICISIDSTKPAVMKAAVEAGAGVINDIHALASKKTRSLIAALKVPVCLMHMRGRPITMQKNPDYELAIEQEINYFFEKRITACLEAGIERHKLILDPGFGFGKTVEHNMQLVKAISCFHKHQLPLMLGVSRKSTIGLVLEKPVEERLIGGLTLAIFAALQKVALIRTHDVSETKQAFKMLEALKLNKK